MLRALSILLALSLLACGDGTAPSPVCATGVDIACRCDDGALGAATCSADGMSFGACACNGQAGTGGGSSSSSSSSTGSGGSGACINDLSNIGTADFHISLTLTTSQTGSVAVVNQRDLCQQEMFWDLRVNGGPLQMETSDSTAGGEYSSIAGSAPVDDGAAHAIVVARVAGMMSIEVDGTVQASGPSPASFGALPPLAQGVDVCDVPGGQQPLSGTLGTVCITSP